MKYWFLGIAIFLIYLVLYLYISGFLIFYSLGAFESSPGGFKVLSNWQNLIFKQRSPFLFESIGSWSLAPYFTIFLSVPNLLLGAFLSFLVAANIVASIYSFRSLGLRGGRGLLTLLGTIPALLSGAACCAPLLILILGIQLSAALLTTFSLLVPVAIIFLSFGLWLAIRRIKSGQF